MNKSIQEKFTFAELLLFVLALLFSYFIFKGGAYGPNKLSIMVIGFASLIITIVNLNLGLSYLCYSLFRTKTAAA